MQLLTNGESIVATARELLVIEVLQLVEKRKTEDIALEIKTLLGNYRVQEKVKKRTRGLIAREALFQDITVICAEATCDKIMLRTTIDEYRVQQKSTNPFRGKKEKKINSTAAFGTRKQASDVIKAKNLLSTELGFGATGATKLDPIAGGPRHKPTARAHCPKCHGDSVASAPSSTENYIYCYLCGWRKYSSAFDGDMNSSLGKEIFARVFDGEDHK